MRYYQDMWWHHQNQHKILKNRFRKKFLWIGLIVLLVVSIIVLLILHDYFNQSKSNPSEELLGDNFSFSVPKKKFENDYYSFTADVDWNEADSQKPNTFYYRNEANGMIKHTLTIYINHEPSINYATRVLPITINNKSIKRTQVSDHCASATGVKPLTKAEPQNVVIANVAMYCASDSTRYIVLLGELNGSTTLDGNKHGLYSKSVIIEYKNLTAFAEPSKIYEISDSLKFK